MLEDKFGINDIYAVGILSVAIMHCDLDYLLGYIMQQSALFIHSCLPLSLLMCYILECINAECCCDTYDSCL